MFSTLFSLDFSLTKTLVVLIAVGALFCLDLAERSRQSKTHYIFAALLGTLLSIGLIKAAEALLLPELSRNTHAMALGIFLMFIAWRLIFGPWESQVKAVVLGTFLFWIAFHILGEESTRVRTAHLLAITIALIPAIMWSALFLEYHRERLSKVILMFFAGMASTVPILFYDALVRHHIELNFFFFRVVPESFNFQNAKDLVLNQNLEVSALQVSLIALFLSSLFVGLIEEGSKYWVLKKSGQDFFTSIDDVMQLAIIVAIGFAFTENVTPSGYFVTFVDQYLVSTSDRDWFGFIGNVAGRSILTSMVHIVSTGVMGYYLGLSIFAAPFLQDAETDGKRYRFVEYVHRVLGYQKKSIFQTQMILTGLVLASALHGFSNFLVTLPDILPGNPRTLGELLGSDPESAWHFISLLLFPCLLYVVGGFWLLTLLFHSKRNMKERGHLITVDTFVRGDSSV